MKQNFTYLYLWMILVTAGLSMDYSFARADAFFQKDTTEFHKLRTSTAKTSYLKSGLHLAMPPLKPAATSTLKVNMARGDEKILSNVQVYPNPVTDQVNLKYNVSRNATVTIKIMDLLGNEVVTLFSQRVDTGEKSFTYSLNNKLTSGFYFVRVVAGTESVIKRISIL